MTLQTPEPRTGTGALQAGAARADITPMPGFPMGGHAIGGRYGYGSLGPLQARALYLESPEGTPLVLVAMDVWGVSAGLHARVVELLQGTHGLTHLGPEHVILAASHTHHSSAGFSSDLSMNLGAGVSPSFSRALFERYADSVANAIAQAHDARIPATLTLHDRPVFDYARNRSLTPFMRNPEATDVLEAHPFPSVCTLPRLPATRPPAIPDSCAAVDPTVRVLKIASKASGALISAGVFVNVHNTVMPNTIQYYHPDLLGLTSSRLEARCEDRCVIAMFNGAEGDVSPTWLRQGIRQLHDAADTLEGAVTTMLIDPEGHPLDADIDVRAVDIRLAGETYEDAERATHTTAKNAVLGRAVLAGAEDGIVESFEGRKGYGEGVRMEAPSDDGHGHKRKTLLRSGEKLLNPRAPLHIARIGGADGVAMVSLPGEFTTVAGMRVKAAVRQEAAGLHEVLLIGLANAYLGYFTTPEEYAAQHYEGGQTWWGEHQLGLFVDRVRCLWRADDPSTCGTPMAPAQRRFDPGAQIEHGLHVRRLDPNLLEEAKWGGFLDVPPARTWRYTLPPPSWPDGREAAKSPIPRTRVEIQVGPCEWAPLRDSNGLPEDDARGRLVTMLTKVDRTQWTWTTIWISLEYKRTMLRGKPGPVFRIVQDSSAGASCSKIFDLDHWSYGNSVDTGRCTCDEFGHGEPARFHGAGTVRTREDPATSEPPNSAPNSK